jgi:hypothetical protein
MTFRHRDYRLLLVVLGCIIAALLAAPAYDFVDSCIGDEFAYDQQKLDSHISPSDRERVMVWAADEKRE